MLIKLINAKIKQQGVALITVMLIVALASIIAAQMTARLQVQMQRSTNISFNQQAYWYALGAEAFSKRVLIKAFKDEPKVTHLEQIWAIGANSYPVDFGEIGGEISDLQSCLNLNALHPSAKTKNQSKADDSATVDDAKATGRNANDLNKLPAATVLEALLINLDIQDISTFEAEAMVESLTDWLDSNDTITGTGGAEDNDYASREFPYLAANNFLGSVNELRLVEHFTPQVILALMPYVCVLPQNSQHLININTVSAEHPKLIQAMLDISLEDAQSVLGARDSSGYEDLTDFFNLPELTDAKLDEWQKAQFVVDSDYFKLKANARFNNSYFDMTSIMQVQSNQEIQIISRTIGRN
ncbi:type II secretion system minor pseudopilin GspK [Colwellia echini]|uniref:Type II secretion system protein K n=1 Tax=Colwellia echini TaxID=1982103 RepID=A0ABY3N0V8_9GAMM|nr:type II secretion system minor pseudopilin GspK [Colwellia echini]TYK67131.1 general secretion pathway protein GspK [Colwellia echini]